MYFTFTVAKVIMARQDKPLHVPWRFFLQ